MKNIYKTIITACLLMIGSCAFAQQTNTMPMLTGSTLMDAVNNVVIDTNSTFFASEKYAIRSGVYQSDQTYASFAVDVNFSKIQVSADCVTRGGADNIINSAGATIGYRVPINNIELDGFVGAKWNWDDQLPYIRLGARFSYSVTDRTFAWIQPELQEDAQHWERPVAVIAIGVGVKF